MTGCAFEWERLRAKWTDELVLLTVSRTMIGLIVTEERLCVPVVIVTKVAAETAMFSRHAEGCWKRDKISLILYHHYAFIRLT